MDILEDLFLMIGFSFYLQSLSHCELITDEGMRYLSSSACAANHLTELDLDNCPLITDTSLDYLVSCTSLRKVEIYDCQFISRTGIRRLKVRCTLLIEFCDELASIKVDGQSCHDTGRCTLSLPSFLSPSLSALCIHSLSILNFWIFLFLQSHLPDLKVHAYFAPLTPPPSVGVGRQRYCRCCVIIWEDGGKRSDDICFFMIKREECIWNGCT